MEKPYTVSGMSDTDELNPTLLSCPACAGVLAVRRNGDSFHCHLECSVGHKFSFESLLEAKEDELEKAMWSAVTLLANLDMIMQKLEEREETGHGGSARPGLTSRMAQARLHAQQLRAMIEEIERPDLSIPMH
jgi:two-component system chemotaxis response regulator CheB